MLVERQGLHASSMRCGQLGSDDGQGRVALLAVSGPVPQAPQRGLPGSGLGPQLGVGASGPSGEAPRFRDPDSVHRHLGLEVRPLLLRAGRVARAFQCLAQVGEEGCDPRTRLPAHRLFIPVHLLAVRSSCSRRLMTCFQGHYGLGAHRRAGGSLDPETSGRE